MRVDLRDVTHDGAVRLVGVAHRAAADTPYLVANTVDIETHRDRLQSPPNCSTSPA